jgi:hypothetical protein
MNPVCREYRRRIPLSLYGEIEPREARALAAHLSRCRPCRKEAAAWEESIALLREGRPVRTAPPDLWDRLAPRLDEVDRERNRGVAPKPLSLSIPRSRPAWVPPLAAAALIAAVLAGVWAVRPRVPSGPPPVLVATALPDPRITRYLERSERLLLGISNIDPTGAGRPFDWTAETSLARDLARESEEIRRGLSPIRDRELYGIASDLERIFLVVSNLSSPDGRREIELVQSVLQEKGIFFAMTLEEIRRTAGATKVKRSA